MNWIHRKVCRSGWWQRYVEEELLPWVLRDTHSGEDALEVGPGPGLTTAILAKQLEKLTVLEIDPRLAESLRVNERLSGIEVVEGDATKMPFVTDRFTSVFSFTMLHHIPSTTLQDEMLRESFRVLRPEGYFLGSDSLWSPLFGLAHIGDTMVLVKPDEFSQRLARSGFIDIQIE
ncbi:MAG TPA: class I SAM-dependent methyltransferase, partial [Gemmatales bacterium]|nr:class I SAM-dependent methyltransferase [Gemmatales bacterium]